STIVIGAVPYVSGNFGYCSRFKTSSVPQPQTRGFSCRTLAGRDPYGQATTSIALPLTRVSPFKLSTVTYVSYQVRRGRTPKRLVNSATRSSVNQASADSRLSQR